MRKMDRELERQPGLNGNLPRAWRGWGDAGVGSNDTPDSSRTADLVADADRLRKPAAPLSTGFNQPLSAPSY